MGVRERMTTRHINICIVFMEASMRSERTAIRSQGRSHQADIFPFTRRSMLVLTVLLCLLAFPLSACGGSGSSQVPDAKQLIKDAQAAILRVTSYHFKLVTANVGTEAKLPIVSAEGDIVVPDKLKANANALLLGNIAQVQIIAIGNQQYILLFGAWQATTGLLDPRTLSDPQKGVASILGHIQNPSTPTDSTVGGRPCWQINGKLDPAYLAGITGGGAPAGSTDDITSCIGKTDKLPYQIIIKGPAATGDTDKTVRTFTLSNFGEQVTIEAPIAPTSTPSLTPSVTP
jgi:lipoprotein LprA